MGRQNKSVNRRTEGWRICGDEPQCSLKFMPWLEEILQQGVSMFSPVFEDTRSVKVLPQYLGNVEPTKHAGQHENRARKSCNGSEGETTLIHSPSFCLSTGPAIYLQVPPTPVWFTVTRLHGQSARLKTRTKEEEVTCQSTPTSPSDQPPHLSLSHTCTHTVVYSPSDESTLRNR